MTDDEIEAAIETAREYLADAREDGDWIDLKPLASEVFDKVVGRGERPSMWASRHVAKVLPGKRKRSKEARNIWIVLAIDEVIDRFPDLRRTRNAATEGPSACSIVVEALKRLNIHMEERTIEDIGDKRASQ